MRDLNKYHGHPLVMFEDPGGTWSALYDKSTGELIHVGDHYNVHETIFEIVGVEWRQDTAFLRGGGKEPGVAQTLAEVADYGTRRQKDLGDAADLEAEAAKLIEQAGDIRRRY